MTIESTRIPPGLSGSKVKVLCALAEAEVAQTALSMTDLAKAAGVSTASMTPLIDSLTKEGLAQRSRLGNDRRKQSPELTVEGLAVVNSMRAGAEKEAA